MSQLSGEDEGIRGWTHRAGVGILSKGVGKIDDDVKAIKLKGDTIEREREREDRL